MSFENLPAELRALPQWTVWRAVLRGGDVTKPPYRLDDPSQGASVHDRSGWGSFERAVAVYRANPSTLSGIGFMLTEDDPYVVFDLDDRTKKVQPQNQHLRDKLERAIAQLGTYTELSPSGNGQHAWVRARTGVAGRHRDEVGAQVYAWQRFITCTGRRCGDPTEILDGQEFVDRLGLGEQRPAAPLTDDPALPLDLSDAEALARARAYVSWFSEQFDGRSGGLAGEWSHTFVRILGVLTKVTGSVHQVWRLIYGSGFVQLSAPAGSGETRPHKARRTFANEVLRVRAGNGQSSYFVEHGKRVWEAVQARRQEEARRLADEVRRVEAELGKLSSKASSLLGFFPMLADGEHRLLTHPPGVVGEFVAATERARHAPYLKFAIPATLATLSGVVGRAYKTQSGGGINLNFILVAPSSTGKTESMKAWHAFMQQCLPRLPATVSGQPRSRILNNGTSSIQGIMPDFEATPSCAWFIEECQSQLSAMSHAKTASESALRDAYNQLYDCATAAYEFSVPRSVAGRNANVQPVANLSVSTFWTTTTSKFDVFSDDALDGFLSRVTVIRHSGPAGTLQREGAALPGHLEQLLTERMAHAQYVDDQYRGARAGGPAALAQAAALLTRVDQRQVADLDWEIVQRCEAVKNASLRGELPETYTAASRLPQTAMRVACLLAVMDNPYAPTVTPAGLKWAFGYLLQNMVSLLSDMDRGELGVQAGDDFAAVVRCYRALLAKPGSEGLPGVPRNALFQHLKSYKVFSSHPLGRSKAITSTIALMLAEGVLEEIAPATGQPGRPTKYLVPVLEHAAWVA